MQQAWIVATSSFRHIGLIHVIRATLIKPGNAVSLNPRRMQDELHAKGRGLKESKGDGEPREQFREDVIISEASRSLAKSWRTFRQSSSPLLPLYFRIMEPPASFVQSADESLIVVLDFPLSFLIAMSFASNRDIERNVANESTTWIVTPDDSVAIQIEMTKADVWIRHFPFW